MENVSWKTNATPKIERHYARQSVRIAQKTAREPCSCHMYIHTMYLIHIENGSKIFSRIFLRIWRRANSISIAVLSLKLCKTLICLQNFKEQKVFFNFKLARCTNLNQNFLSSKCDMNLGLVHCRKWHIFWPL